MQNATTVSNGQKTKAKGESDRFMWKHVLNNAPVHKQKNNNALMKHQI